MKGSRDTAMGGGSAGGQSVGVKDGGGGGVKRERFKNEE